MTLRLFTLSLLLGYLYVTYVDARTPTGCQQQNDWCNDLNLKCCPGAECHYLYHKASSNYFGKCIRIQWGSPPPSEEEMASYAAMPNPVAPVNPGTSASLGDDDDDDEYDEYPDEEDDDYEEYDEYPDEEDEASELLQPAQTLQAQTFQPAQGFQAKSFPPQPLQLAPPVPQYQRILPIMEAPQFQRAQPFPPAQTFQPQPLQLAPPVPQYRQILPIMESPQLQQLRSLQEAQRLQRAQPLPQLRSLQQAQQLQAGMYRQVPIQQNIRRYY